MEDIECGKYELVFTSAENVLVRQFFFVNEKNSHTVSPEYAGLNQTNYSVQTFECSCLLLQRIVYDQMEEKL